MDKTKENKAITLVALVITIIILLILAGITINSLTENGLFGKVKESKEKESEAEVKEKVELLLAEYQLDKADNKDLTLLEYFEQKVNEKKIDSVVDNENETIDIKLKGYTVKINVEHQKIISIEISNDIEFSYKLASYENNKFKILIIIEDKENGIDTIYLPDGIVKTENGNTRVGIDYEIDEGVDYIITARNTKGIERKETINFTKPEKPTTQAAALGYPTLTLTGVEKSKVEINFDQREEFLNYYSIDNGETWNLYKNFINITSSVIKAKSVHKKCQDIFEEVEFKLGLPEDSLTDAAVDGDMDKYESKKGGQSKFYVDSSTWNQYLDVKFAVDYSSGYSRSLYIQFYNSNDEKIETKTWSVGTGVIYDTRNLIPSDTHYIILGQGGGVLGLKVYEVCINEPLTPNIIAKYDELKVNKQVLEYPILTQNGVMNCSIDPEIGTNIEIEIPNQKGVENYYTLDGGNTWELYKEKIETEYKEEGLIQAKSINKYYNIESEIVSLKNYINDPEVTCTSKSAVGKEAYDGDWETNTLVTNNIMTIDEELYGKRMRYKTHSGTWTVHFYDKDSGKSLGYDGGNPYVRELTIKIPENSRIQFRISSSSSI